MTANDQTKREIASLLSELVGLDAEIAPRPRGERQADWRDIVAARKRMGEIEARLVALGEGIAVAQRDITRIMKGEP